MSIAVKHAQSKYGLERVAIVDWDIHHGNGTQDIFYKSGNTLYMSLHRYDEKTFYPRTEAAQPEFIGEDEGKGFNVNVAWETGAMPIAKNRRDGKQVDIGNPEYKLAFEQVILPVLKQFNPELIIVSCGFDSALHD